MRFPLMKPGTAQKTGNMTAKLQMSGHQVIMNKYIFNLDYKNFFEQT